MTHFSLMDAHCLQVAGAAMSTMDEEMSTEQLSCRETMREGKRLLRNGQGVLLRGPALAPLLSRKRTSCSVYARSGLHLDLRPVRMLEFTACSS